MGQGRSNKDGMALVWQLQIVGIATAARDKTDVFLAQDGLADSWHKTSIPSVFLFDATTPEFS